MALEVIWTPRSEADPFKVLEYLEKEWSMKVVHSFLDDINEIISLITMYPQIFRRAGFEDVREIVVSSLRSCGSDRQNEPHAETVR